MKLWAILLGIFSSASLITGCAQKLPNPGSDALRETQKLVHLPIQTLPAALRTAQIAELDVLSPRWYACAKKSLENTTEAISSDNLALAEKKATFGIACLHEASIRSQSAKEDLESTLLSRRKTLRTLDDLVSLEERLGDLDSRTLQARRNQLDDQFRKLTQNENGIDEKKALELGAKYEVLQKDITKHALFSSAKNRIQKAIEEGAEKYAPAALTHAEKLISEAESLVEITENDDERLLVRRLEAELYSTELLQITREAKILTTKSPEELAAWWGTKTQELGSEFLAVHPILNE
jgi:hypothetical protein